MNSSSTLSILSIKKKIPLSVTFELIYDCPLSCIHCYICKKKAVKKKMMMTQQVIKILEMLRKAGAMSLVFTGGEALLRKDLPEICLAAKNLNFDFSVYTSLIPANYQLLERLKESGLHKIEVSLYGHQKEHDSITKMRGSYSLTIKNLKIAKLLGFKIKLKTPLTGLNPKGPYFVEKIAVKNGFYFAIDPLLSPRNDGSDLPSSVKAKKKDIEKIVMWESRRHSYADFKYCDDKSPLCFAGFNTAAVNPQGELYPCLQFPYSFGNLLKKDFQLLWRSEKAENFREMLYLRPKKCLDCHLLDYCSYCPGFDYVRGNISKPGREFCFMAFCTKKAIDFRQLSSKMKKTLY